MKNKPGRLFLIPNHLGNTLPEANFPPAQLAQIQHIRHYLVENLKPARQLLRAMWKEAPIDDMEFEIMPGFSDGMAWREVMQPLLKGFDMGIISDAGTPAIADPGAIAVKQAHAMGAEVIPCIGPNSIILALMASGLNGQQFSFIGYLPKEPNERKQKIIQLTKLALGPTHTFICIETPYRNQHTAQTLIETLPNAYKLCIAADLTTSNQWIKTLPVPEWKQQLPDLSKRQVIFLFGN